MLHLFKKGLKESGHYGYKRTIERSWINEIKCYEKHANRETQRIGENIKDFVINVPANLDQPKENTTRIC